jgi:hypothetical protein
MESSEDEWSSYFTGVIHFLEESERHYGVANQQFTKFVLERLEITQRTCRVIKMAIDDIAGLQTFQEYL